MTNERLARAERQAAAWLDAGPTAAPDHLLGQVLAETSRRGQRAAMLARALGAPDGTRPNAWAAQGRMVWLLLALLLASAVVVVLGIGGRGLDPRLVVAPYQATPSPDPERTAIAPRTATPDRRLVFRSAGFAATIGPEWRIVELDGDAVTLGTRYGLGPTLDMTYLLEISITSAEAPFEDALETALAGRAASMATPIAVDAGRAVFLPSTSLEPPPLVLIEHGERVFTLAIRDIRTPGAGGTQLRELAATIEWLGDPTASPTASPTIASPTPPGLYRSYTDPSGFEIQYGHRYSGDELTDVQAGLGFVTVVGKCVSDFCPLSALVSGGTFDEGPVVALNPTRRVAGSTLDELEAAWVDVFGPLTKTPRSIAVDGEFGRLLQSGESAAAILAIHGDRAYAILAQPFLDYGLNTPFLNTVVANFTFVNPS